MTDTEELKNHIDDFKKTKKVSGSFWTKTRTFKRLCKWAFKACDKTDSKRLSKDQLYSGLLLVYINIAKYAGPAACYPPSRTVVNVLFDACDDDNSGDISEEEFVTIMILLASQMTWRIVTYYLFLILMLPHVVKKIIEILCWARLDDFVHEMGRLFHSHAPQILISLHLCIPDSAWVGLVESLTSFAIFSAIIPFCWGKMDNYLDAVAEKKKENNNKDE